jgi:hypothetical protein
MLCQRILPRPVAVGHQSVSRIHRADTSAQTKQEGFGQGVIVECEEVAPRENIKEVPITVQPLTRCKTACDAEVSFPETVCKFHQWAVVATRQGVRK